MPSVCFYFQVHQPYRLKPYNCFQIGSDHSYEDEQKDRTLMERVAQKCYLPMNALLLKLISKYDGKFKVAFSISGTAMEQFKKYQPRVLDSFIELFNTGCVEILSETYYHSLSYNYSKDEFVRQVEKHRSAIKSWCGQTPRIFRNTELIYNNEIAQTIQTMGYEGIICEGVDRLLGYRSPNYLYHPPKQYEIKCLLKNYRLSDDIAFRFSDKNWKEFPLQAHRYADWIHESNGEVLNLFMDYETFGEHQWPETGIFNFMEHLPGEVLKRPNFDFKTPSELIDSYSVLGEYDVPDFTSWADVERDLSAWCGNSLQNDASERIYQLESAVKLTKDEMLIEQWAKLLTSDHFYYMCTKYWSDGDVHKYFSPYNSPYDAYINFMNVVTDLEQSINENVVTLFKQQRKLLTPYQQ